MAGGVEEKEVELCFNIGNHQSYMHLFDRPTCDCYDSLGFEEIDVLSESIVSSTNWVTSSRLRGFAVFLRTWVVVSS